MNNIQLGKIGVLHKEVFSSLKLEQPKDNTVYIGQTNIKHMQEKHPTDFEKYGIHIQEIIETPDYVGLNKKDQSIECVKEFINNSNGEYVKVAVRLSSSGTMFTRTLYILNPQRVANFIAKGTLLPLTK